MTDLSKLFEEAKQEETQAQRAELPDGKYTAMISRFEVGHRNYNSDNGMAAENPARDTYLLIQFQIVGPDHKGWKETIFPSLSTITKTGRTTPDFVLTRAMRNLYALGQAVGLTLTNDMFKGTAKEIHEKLAEAFSDHVMLDYLELTKQTRPNPKNPAYPYVNYYFAKSKQETPVRVSLDQMANAKQQQTQPTQPQAQPTQPVMTQQDVAPQEVITPAERQKINQIYGMDTGDMTGQELNDLPF